MATAETIATALGGRKAGVGWMARCIASPTCTRFPSCSDRVVASIAVWLHLQYERGRALWRLSSGPFVPADVAAIVITKTCVVLIGDTLFNDLPSQTWRFTDD